MRMRDQESRQRRAAVEKVSVRITAPVSLCLLPAFLVLAVVPPAVGLFAKVEISSTSSR
jgi:pilus assembly protein TadC